MGGFEGQSVLITGGTRGIGRGCATAFAEQGARVAICGRDAAKAEAVASEIALQTGADVRGFAADMADSPAVDKLVGDAFAAFGGIDVLVNNAGLVRDGLLMRMKNEDWDLVVNTNLSGVFYACRAVARPMLKARKGCIINVSSIIGLRGQSGQANYAAAKAGLIGFSKSLAQEFGSRNIRVNVLAPGYIETDMTSVMTDEMKKAILDRVPLARTGTTDDISGVVLFLASPAAAYITGAVIQVDGGLAM